MDKIFLYWQVVDRDLILTPYAISSAIKPMQFVFPGVCPQCQTENPNNQIIKNSEEQKITIKSECCQHETSQTFSNSSKVEIFETLLQIHFAKETIALLPLDEEERIQSLLGESATSCPTVKIQYFVPYVGEFSVVCYYSFEQGVLVAKENQEYPIDGLAFSLGKYKGVSLSALKKLFYKKSTLLLDVLHSQVIESADQLAFTKGYASVSCYETIDYDEQAIPIYWRKNELGYALSLDDDDWPPVDRKSITVQLQGTYCFNCDRVAPEVAVSMNPKCYMSLSCCGAICEQDIVNTHHPVVIIHKNGICIIDERLMSDSVKLVPSQREMEILERALGRKISDDTAVIQLRGYGGSNTISWAGDFYYCAETHKAVPTLYNIHLEGLVLELGTDLSKSYSGMPIKARVLQNPKNFTIYNDEIGGAQTEGWMFSLTIE